MRKLSIFLLSGLLLFPLAACGGNTNGIPPGDEPVVDHRTDAYEIGDIILKDGTLVKSGELTSINSDNPPIAVAAVLREDGTAIGLGVHISGQSEKIWKIRKEQVLRNTGIQIYQTRKWVRSHRLHPWKNQKKKNSRNSPLTVGITITLMAVITAI